MGVKAKPIIFKEQTKDNLEWAGDFIDACGWFSVFRTKTRTQYKVNFRVEPDEAGLIDRFERMFGGYRVEQEKDGKKFIWLNVQNGRCIEMLKVLRNYVQRKEVLEAMLKLYSIVKNKREGGVDELLEVIKRGMKPDE